MDTRTAVIERTTLETRVRVALALDGSGQARLSTGLGFFDHMLDQIARHGRFDLDVAAQGDLHVDAHHTVEDVGIALGQALRQALGEKKGVVRYGHAYVPLDEALARAVVDLSGRPGLVFVAEFARARVGDFDVDLVREFFQALTNNAAITLHLDCLRGNNVHHQIEAMFKAFARALAMATALDARLSGAIPSTKGCL